MDLLILGLEDTLIHTAETNAERYGAELTPDAARLIDDALEQGCRLAIATSMTHREASALLESAFGDSLHQTISVIVTEADFGKPVETGPYGLIQRTLGVDPRSCIVIDANDQARVAANRAGMRAFKMDGTAGFHAIRRERRAPAYPAPATKAARSHGMNRSPARASRPN